MFCFDCEPVAPLGFLEVALDCSFLVGDGLVVEVVVDLLAPAAVLHQSEHDVSMVALGLHLLFFYPFAFV